MTDPLKFLFAIWRIQPDGHFFLAHFDETHMFRERSFPRETEDDLTEYKRKPRLSLVGDGVDLYFCPNSFTEANRRNNCSNGGRWLYADLDESDPRKLDASLKPTIAWETSPNRYQAMWLMDKHLPADKLAETNQWMTYTTNADKGGWSPTKVLRVPGSVSHKRDTPHEVKLMWSNGPRYKADDLCAKVRSSTITTPTPVTTAEERSARQLRLKYKDVMPAQARKLLRTRIDQVRGDRSAMLWKLENLLLECGLNTGEVFVLAKASAWNKYRGEQREEARLWAEINRAATRHDADKPVPAKTRKKVERLNKVKSSKAESAEETLPKIEVVKERVAQRERDGQFPGLLGVSLNEFLAKPYPKPSWLVKDIWTTGAYGVVGGTWKSYKSMLCLDLALSLSTGDEFLGEFPIGNGPEQGDDEYEPDPQSVLYLHQEGSRGLIADRLGRIAHAKGYWGVKYKDTPSGPQFVINDSNIPLYISSFPGMDLADPNWVDILYDTILTRGHKMVVLETMYLLTGDADENAANEMKPVLKAIAEVAVETKCAIATSHHYNKATDTGARTISRLSGSGIFARWLESGVFLERVGEESDNTTKLDVVHRELPAMPPKYLKFGWDDSDEGDYNIEILDRDEFKGEMIEIPAGGSVPKKHIEALEDA
jgi:hypothetical protein